MRLGIFLVMFSMLSPVLAGKGDKDKRRPFEMNVVKTDQEMRIDGQLDEDIWSEVDAVSGFVQQFPDEGDPATEMTEVKMVYDDNFLYVSAVMHDKTPGANIVSSLKRDFIFADNDAFGVILGPYDDGNNGFFFSVNPWNIQLEGLVNNGTYVSEVWDNRWYSAVQRYEGYWAVEIAIPFKTLRFTEGTDYWKVNFIRNDLKNFETSSWVPVPINQRITNLAFTGYMNWEHPLRKTGPNIALIPYAAGNTAKDFQGGTPSEQGGAVGMDAKIAVTPSLNLDLTVNPDFSTVEVDQQQTNLNRFELYFPERRQFFLENADLFSSFGFRQIRPFFSRRIGIATDSMGRSSNNRILYGARLNGNVGDNLRVGLLNMQTAQEDAIGFPGQNYTVGTFQRKVFSRSSIAGIFVNRQTTHVSESGTSMPEFNRMVGVDYNLASSDNKWNGKFFYHQSFSPHKRGDEYTHASYLGYNTKNWHIMWNHEYVGENYNAEVGFVPRRGYWRLEPSIQYRFFPKGKKVLQHSFRVSYDAYTDRDFGMLTDEWRTFNYRLEWKNTSSLNFNLFNEYVYLFAPFDPTRTGGERLEAGTDYRYTRAGVTYTSDTRKFFNYSTQVYHGEYFNGDRFYWRTNLNYRIQPYGSISLFAEYNKIDMPAPYNSADLWLVGPRFEVSFTDELFLSTFVQYNNQIDNLNINTRFQWRFRPVSDLFIVYTDNYFPEYMQVKNRSLVLKLTYWINV
ncbi:DUF5916 domain-containing protein [Litoribacter ruber]|nr:DUF5916 domain-containing protein [Litoribacter alkaliphilus]